MASLDGRLAKPQAASGERVHLPAGGHHGALQGGHEAPRRLHAAGARPQLAGEMPAEQVEQQFALELVETAIGGGIAIEVVQGLDQVGIRAR